MFTLQVLKNLKHENLVNFEEAFLQTMNDGGRDILYVVMEFLDGGPLNDVAENLILHEKHIAAIVKEVFASQYPFHVSNDIFPHRIIVHCPFHYTDFGRAELHARAKYLSSGHQV